MMRYPDVAELQFLMMQASAEAQKEYAKHLNALNTGAAASQPTSIAAEAQQGLLIEGTARRVDAS